MQEKTTLTAANGEVYNIYQQKNTDGKIVSHEWRREGTERPHYVVHYRTSAYSRLQREGKAE